MTNQGAQVDLPEMQVRNKWNNIGNAEQIRRGQPKQFRHNTSIASGTMAFDKYSGHTKGVGWGGLRALHHNISGRLMGNIRI